MTPERWRKIEELFDEAVGLEPRLRHSFVLEKAEGDQELAAAVAELLKSEEAAGNFIETPIWTDSRFVDTSARRALSDSMDEVTGDEPVDNYLGRQLGAFRITRELGRGGMGAVFLGERADGEFDQKVAIKLIKRGMDSDFIVRRFRHERQILASFEHPFIARLFDGGTSDEGVPYFVMEYVEGATLYDYADAQRLTIVERLKLFQKVCSAIKYAHERQIVHRDIKPSNILINRAGAPKLLDFGIAKILDPELIHESVNPTASMLRMMTPDYASPEQVRGSDVTTASDIYSLGILLYELLTGHRPYNFQGRALHEVSQAVCEVMPDVPSKILSQDDHLLPRYSGRPATCYETRRVTPEKLADLLADRLDDVVMKAVAKEPSERYPDVASFSEDITKYLSGFKVSAPHYSRAASAPTPDSLRPTETGKAVAILPLKFINLGPNEDTDDRFLGLGLADALISRLSKVRRFSVRPTSSILPFSEGNVDPIRAGKELNVDFILDGNIKKAKDRLRVSVQLLDVRENAAIWAATIDEKLADVLTLEDTLANKVIEILLPQLTGSELELFARRGTEEPEAFKNYLRGRYYFNSFTEEGFARAFVSFHEAIAADPNYALAYAGLADYYNWLGIIGVLPPQECFLPAIENAKRAVEIDDELSEAHASLGFSLHAGEYDWADGERHLLRALQLKPNNASAYVWYSIVLFTERRFDEGLRFAQRSIEIDPLTPFNHHNLAWGLYFARRYKEAEEQYHDVVSRFPTYGLGYYGLSKVLRRVGDTKGSLREIGRAKELMGDSIFARLAEAESLAADGQTAAALSKIAEIEALAGERHVSPYQRSLVYCYLNDKEKALSCLEEAFEIKDAWLNWQGAEPVFDLLRDEPQFNEILEKTGYRMHFSSFAESGVDLNQPAGEPSTLAERTTLVIEESEVTDPGFAGTKSFFGSRTGALITFAALVLLLIGALATVFYNNYYTSGSVAGRAISYQNPSIVVLPFDSESGADFNLGVGLADALSSKLGNLRGIRVLSSSTGRALAGMPSKQIGTETGAMFVVRGTLDQQGDRYLLNAEFVDAVDGATLWQREIVAQDRDIFSIETRLAEAIWRSLGTEPMPLERQQLEKRYTTNKEAYELYLIGRYQLLRRTPTDLRQAITTFGAALREDPNFALAYVGMADAYALVQLFDIEPPANAYGHAKENARRALEIDPELAEAHVSMGYILFFADGDRNGAELEFRRALQLNPSISQAHHWFALFLAATGKSAEAIQEIENAKQLDPRSLSVLAGSATVRLYAGDIDGAIEEANRALALEPAFVPALKAKRWAAAAKGDMETVAATFVKELSYSGGDLSEPGWQIIAAQAGKLADSREAALEKLDEAANHPSIRDNPYAFAYEIALAYEALGRRDAAIAHLQRAAAANAHGFNFVEVDPRLQSLQREPVVATLINARKNRS